MSDEMTIQVTSDNIAELYTLNGHTEDADGNPLDPKIKNYIFVDGVPKKPNWGAPPMPDVVHEIAVESPNTAMVGTDELNVVLSAMASFEDLVEKQNREIAKQTSHIEAMLGRLVMVEQRQLKAELPQAVLVDNVVTTSPVIPNALDLTAFTTTLPVRQEAQTVPADQVPPGRVLDDSKPRQAEDVAPKVVSNRPPPVQLSTRVKNIIESNGCRNLGDVTQFTKDEVSLWPGVGIAVLTEIELRLKEANSYFRM